MSEETGTNEKVAADGAPKSPRFQTILSCRSRPDRRPSELEIHLRDQCQNLKVVEKLSGAHFVFSSNSSLAVKAYYPNDIERFEKLLKQACPENKPLKDYVEKPIEHDVDNNLAYAANFRFSIIVFVYPHEYKLKQLSRIDSFTFQTQRLFQGSESAHSARIFFAADTEQAIATIAHTADAYSPAKLRLKRAFAERQKKMNEDPNRIFINSMRALAKDKDIPAAEMDIVINSLGCLMAVIRADESTFAEIPISRSSRDKIINCFHPTPKGSATAAARKPAALPPQVQKREALRPTNPQPVMQPMTMEDSKRHLYPPQQTTQPHYPPQQHFGSASLGYERQTMAAPLAFSDPMYDAPCSPYPPFRPLLRDDGYQVSQMHGQEHDWGMDFDARSPPPREIIFPSMHDGQEFPLPERPMPPLQAMGPPLPRYEQPYGLTQGRSFGAPPNQQQPHGQGHGQQNYTRTPRPNQMHHVHSQQQPMIHRPQPPQLTQYQQQPPPPAQQQYQAIDQQQRPMLPRDHQPQQQNSMYASYSYSQNQDQQPQQAYGASPSYPQQGMYPPGSYLQQQQQQQQQQGMYPPNTYHPQHGYQQPQAHRPRPPQQQRQRGRFGGAPPGFGHEW